MDPRYYFTSLARRPLTLGGKIFKFAVFSLNGGAASGVYKTDNAEEIRILDDAVAGRRGVREMPAEEGEKCLLKATPTLRFASTRVSSPLRVVQPPILPQLSVEERPGVPAAGRPTGVTPNENLLAGPTDNRPSIGNLLKIGKVNPPKPFADSHDKTAKAVKRADKKLASKGEERPGVRVIRGSEGISK